MNQRAIYMPNEIFSDLASSQIRNSRHRAFSYSYLYFVSYLYRYCEYYKKNKMTQLEIKKQLGISEKEKRVDYLIKKDGILDKMGYTLTTTNYPLSWSIGKEECLQFYTVDEYNKSNMIIENTRNFKVKYPIKCFYRTVESKNRKVLDGTYFETSNTHRIDHNKFIVIMKENDLGVMGLFIFGYIKMMTDMYKNYQVPTRTLSAKLGISNQTLNMYLKKMSSNDVNLIKIKRKRFIGKGGEANEYTID
ncbi:hypothetical protein B7C51_25100 (plasmid) [Paenibacillus larvae subsp. pulvifaciens]|uniref:Uncharacterized protein n=1 Tax=Paenibacillus larvae subsp. pulvifaciens TaxID=1477 RepID=A0A1V0UZU6_9BACL|nr:hypothetical protein [Paenibacillus larvae]ARF70752.1 hypothetical protein B7C51_25100 [Paenibacillus larvae subsp. pulvifaciens]